MSTISASTTSSTAYKVAADTTGTLVFQTGATPTTAVTIDASQNVGVGVTPSAWTLKAVQNGNAAFWTSATNAYLSSNLYYGSGGRTYISNGYSSELGLSTGGFQFQISASGTAGGAITQTQAMTLDSSGNLLVGQTTKSQSTVGFYAAPSGEVSGALAASTNAATQWNTYSTGAGAYRFYVGMGGTVFATSIVITAISDQRLKENVRDLDTGLDSIMALQPRRFDWKEGKGQDKKNAAGFIAQEFETVFPECVSTSMAGADGIEYKNINHETLIPTLVKAMQEQQALITQLQADVAALKGAA